MIMGISIAVTCLPLPEEFPRPLVIRLQCDSAIEDIARGFFCLGFEEFNQADGFVAAHSLAMARGWLERQSPQGRIWLCPMCSGK